MNNVVFKNDKCNPSFVLELVKKNFYETMAYNKCTNFSIFEEVADLTSWMQVNFTI